MNYCTYTKQIPPFFQGLLDKLTKIDIFALKDTGEPYKQIHYYPTKSGIRLYTSDIIKVSHELAHMLELTDDSRLLQFDYGIKKYFPKTHKGQLQAIAREARVRGIQSRLIHIAHGHCQMLYHRWAHLLVHPSGQIGKFKSNEQILEWSNSIVRSAYSSWCPDRIVSEWNHKAEFINHWIETRCPSEQEHKSVLQHYELNSQWVSHTNHVS